MPARQFAKAFRSWIGAAGNAYNADVGFLEDPHRVSWIHGRVSTYVSKDTEGRCERMLMIVSFFSFFL